MDKYIEKYKINYLTPPIVHFKFLQPSPTPFKNSFLQNSLPPPPEGMKSRSNHIAIQVISKNLKCIPACAAADTAVFMRYKIASPLVSFSKVLKIFTETNRENK